MLKAEGRDPSLFTIQKKLPFRRCYVLLLLSWLVVIQEYKARAQFEINTYDYVDKLKQIACNHHIYEIPIK